MAVEEARVPGLSPGLAPPLAVEDISILAEVRAAMFAGRDRVVRVGRYELGPSLGRGGGGCVFRGHDPELGRTVAIKLLREDGIGQAESRRRVLSEAQALARLAHDNVVTIYDVGEYRLDGIQPGSGEVPTQGVFIAMERLRGATLDGWLASRPSAAEILSVGIAAGRGVAAAHDAGIVHCDIKPSNVFITEDGRVKVIDFGVAGGSVSRPRSSGGTPWYMAPEQFERATTSERSDQHALCFVIYEALFGRVPADDLDALQRLKRAGLPPGRRRRGVTRNVRATLARGLAPDPAARFDSVRALLDALQRRDRPRRSVWLVGAALVAGSTLAVLAQSDRVRHVNAVEPGFGFALDRRPDATLARAQALLDAGRVDEAAELCAAMPDAAQPQAHARAQLCRGRIERARGNYQGAARTLGRAYWLASEHGEMDIAARAAAMTANNFVSLGQLDQAAVWIRHADAALARASSDAAHIEADLEIARASAEAGRGHPDAALPHYQRAFEIRTRALGEGSVGSATALKLVANCLQRLDRPGEALPLHNAVVRDLLAALGEDHIALASALNDRATSHQGLGDLEQALADLTRALAVVERTGGPQHPDAGMIRHNLGYTLRRLGRPLAALAAYRRSLEIREATHGPTHIKTLKTLNNLGQLLVETGSVDEGERVLLDALTRYESRPPHRLAKNVLANLANAASKRGDDDTAERYRRRRASLLAALRKDPG